MKCKKRIIGLIMLSFGSGILANIIFPCVSFLIGVLLVGLGILQFYC